MKFWSCCQRKTTEFDSFLEQEGCTSGRHNWTKENTLPETVKVNCNGVLLTVFFVYDAGKAQYDRSFNLQGIVDPSGSRVNLTATKMEIVLKKAEARAWSALETHPPAKPDEEKEKVES
ncbi:unnamed protein product [Dibothriocephalus latus]|uniref:CHORD domain-containing protein n=1 Tax=Dibothriocephalus latus TaxID=60516 RepID=A0A3P7NMF9_DIBLA|nr:unnamed protein product [Dibothriocephalus latus]